MTVSRQHRAFRGFRPGGAVLAVLAALPFARVASYPFIRFDDYEYVVDNPLVNSGLSWTGIVKAFTSFHMGYWLPLTWISHMADVSLFGMAAGGHHLVNVLLHAATTAALFLVLLRLTGARGRSALAAALFGVHPLRVESVAWIAERKDVLCALFFMLALLAWERYVRKPGAARYLAALLAFSAGLLAKPMIVTLPVLLLLLDYWPLGRAPRPHVQRATAHRAVSWRRLALEKILFFLLAAVAAGLTLFTQRQAGIMKDLELFPLAARLASALYAPVVYLGKTIWPVSLGIFYPHPLHGLAAWKVAGAALLLAAVTLLTVRGAKTRPYLATGWIWYLAMLLPILGLFQSGMQAFADRFTYLPHAGLFVAVVWLAGDVVRHRWAGRPAFTAAGAGLLLLLAARTVVQTGYWRDSVTLFERTRAVAGDSWLTSNNLGIAYLDAGRVEEAAGAFRQALRLRPDYDRAWHNLGVALELQGRTGESVAAYREALRIRPENVAARLNLGAALGRAGFLDEAISHLGEAVRLLPGSASAHFNLGLALELRGDHGEALTHLREAARLAPSDDETRRAVERVAAGGGEPLSQGRRR